MRHWNRGSPESSWISRDNVLAPSESRGGSHHRVFKVGKRQVQRLLNHRAVNKSYLPKKLSGSPTRFAWP